MLTRNRFFVKEHVGIMKLTDTFDIIDPDTEQQIGIAREEPPGWVKAARLMVSKKFLPNQVNVYEDEQQPPIFSMLKSFTLFRSKVRVVDGNGTELGYFLSKILSLGGGFHVFDTQDRQVAEVKGDWKGWNFTFIGADGEELGTVTKKWAGIGKELFTSADNYMISIADGHESNPTVKILLLAAALAIDTVYKERN